MTVTFKAMINFSVKPVKAGASEATELGNVITWDMQPKYEYESIDTIVSVRIERASTIGSEFTWSQTVDAKSERYVDTEGEIGSAYRIIMIDKFGAESEPSLTKSAFICDTIVIYGQVRALNGKPMPDVDILFKLVRPPRVIADKTVICSSTILAYTGADGFFETPMVRGVIAKLSSERLGIEGKDVIIPATGDFLNLTDLL